MFTPHSLGEICPHVAPTSTLVVNSYQEEKEGLENSVGAVRNRSLRTFGFFLVSSGLD
ncbi:hypothetical protein LEMLEM_LOCUS11188 [Lemmus lemmus]